MNVAIAASRLFQPMTAIADALRELPPDATVTAHGAAPACAYAQLAATSLGLDARHATLSPSRRELVDCARAGGQVWLLVADDPATGQMTEGIAQIAALLAAEGITARQIASPLTPKTCKAMTDVLMAVQRVGEAKGEGRRGVAIRRALQLATQAHALCQDIEHRLTAGMVIDAGDDERDERWLRWLRSYEALTDTLRDTERVLVSTGVAA